MKKLVLIFIFLISSSFGIESSFEYKGKVFTVSLEGMWTRADKVFGVDHVFYGPKLHGRRPVLSFTTSGTDTKKINLSDLTRFEHLFVKNKQKALDKMLATDVKFERVKRIELNKKDYAYVFQTKFSLNTEHFVENSYYISCGQVLVHAKSLLTTKHGESYQNRVDNALKGLKCE